ncbi:unnamed protein product, partial [Iphiclides podalirius]
MFKFLLFAGIAISFILINRIESKMTTTKSFFSQIGLRETILGRFFPSTSHPLNRNCKCSNVYKPVCGSNNKSYYNACYLTCDKQNSTVVVEHSGKCLMF